MLSRFHTIPACHGQTDRQTDGRTDRITISISRVSSSMLTRDKKINEKSNYSRKPISMRNSRKNSQRIREGSPVVSIRVGNAHLFQLPHPTYDVTVGVSTDCCRPTAVRCLYVLRPYHYYFTMCTVTTVFNTKIIDRQRMNPPFGDYRLI